MIPLNTFVHLKDRIESKMLLGVCLSTALLDEAATLLRLVEQYRIVISILKHEPQIMTESEMADFNEKMTIEISDLSNFISVFESRVLVAVAEKKSNMSLVDVEQYSINSQNFKTASLQRAS